VCSALLAAVGIRRAQRLKHRSEFAAVYRQGRPFRSEFVVLRTLRTNGPVSRFGFTTGRALGGAVIRNRVKRRLREIVRSLPVAEGWDIVLNARSNAVGAEYSLLARAVESLMRKSGVLK
jgi:ribonuclease P protein component